MQILGADELERLVREAFPGKAEFTAESELGVDLRRRPIVTFVHGGPDPFLDRPFEDWLRGAPVFVAAHQLLNRLCRAGALAPGNMCSPDPLDAGPCETNPAAPGSLAERTQVTNFRPRLWGATKGIGVVAPLWPILYQLTGSPRFYALAWCSKYRQQALQVVDLARRGFHGAHF